MGNSYKYKSVSADFAIFLNTFLIISTVIVFAVLIFISYQNIKTEYLNNTMTSSANICADAAADYVMLSDDYEDPDQIDELMSIYLRSNLMAEKGSVFIVDATGGIVYTNGMFVVEDSTSLIKLAVNSVNTMTSGMYQDYQELTGTRSRIVTAMKIQDTGLYSVVISVFDISDYMNEYMTIIIYPVLVSMIAAIALFVGFTGLTIRPLRSISRTVSKVAEGNLSVRVDKKYTTYGDSTGMLTLSSDLTEMARNVNSMIETLENQENDRAIFISSVAHDIRTPLTSINGFVTAMMDGTIPPELHEKYMIRIKAEVDRIRSLVVSMTEASSLSHVDPNLMEEFDLKEAVDDLMSELEPQLRAKNITCEVRISENGGTAVYGEVQMLCRVLLNIVTNAIKFTPDGGKIIISSPHVKNHKRLITVEDSGPGVEPDKRARVFESFYKVDPSRKQEGFGLGLYICKQVLAGHGQLIRLEESPELGGAMFVFSFPTPPSKS